MHCGKSPLLLVVESDFGGSLMDERFERGWGRVLELN
jgi:hypothetical protein